ncbi:MAG: ornithine cyclodeaminase [Legionellales bacterium]|jgi:ornithine cyclodeaminase|nr:ornithine cyclodeaminase [Legionellales bacterium]
MKLIDIKKLQKIITEIGLLDFFDLVIARLELDYKNWDNFEKNARHATHSKDGVIELMPASDSEYYAMKFVNGHPNNPSVGKLSVMAVGLLAQVADGMPLMFCEMTLLTAIRTACTSALVAKYAARPESSILGFIGVGAQSEFQAIAFSRVFNIEKIYGYDIDHAAAIKTKNNLAKFNIDFIVASSVADVLVNCDILTTATAAKKQDVLVHYKDIPRGCHINAIGGDCPGKTELDINEFEKCNIIVEYIPQTQIEGEIQNLKTNLNIIELHDLIKGNVVVRADKDDITLFDSVGFALEDYSVLRVLYDAVLQQNIVASSDYIPKIDNPKNLFDMFINMD